MSTSSGARFLDCLSWRNLAAVLFMIAALNADSAISGTPVKSANPACPTAFWNFGDSLTDTGGTLDVFAYSLDPERSPYGESFFGRPAKRFCNGRVVPDYFSLAFNYPLLQPYLQAGAFDYNYGANFAAGGTTASNDTSRNPIFLINQVSEFVRLKQSATSQKNQFACHPFKQFLPRDDSYGEGLYTFEIGGNDVLNAILLRNLTAEQIITQVIPEAMINILATIKILTSNGAKKFLFFNAPNAGCSTIAITVLASIPGVQTDEMGCIVFINELDQAYNKALNDTIASARLLYPGRTISIFNYYDANLEILTNPSLYGFNPALTKRACCGAPGLGTLNYNPLVTCGNPGSNKCANSEEYVNWDGVHFTDAFYRQISLWALSGKFTDCPVNYTSLCNLDFRNFAKSSTYNSVYPQSCRVTFT
ncbi:hypothetical protein MPTK1_5g12200 [Marchantia polymorpha subsp. ruderalis]|uniref:GDSL esterase/lipase n=2 Tax=Marchantia polymorpha TaxID=3197 RepID=A0AAF6BHJ2_MARPO|nr:hypothetical protein MARPO_0274s0001 [Marchantia polymorpha]BBN11476.1 hypothetical protein Mp_5g12200 [Marchantia polymorpha subsp. ruderalis]|eukprot:PTQ26900.1 hypothetical protein MARPO_0274s0001 [Marchantia polymorpha]